MIYEFCFLPRPNTLHISGIVLYRAIVKISLIVKLIINEAATCDYVLILSDSIFYNSL